MKKLIIFDKFTKQIIARHNEWDDAWDITKWGTFDAANQVYMFLALTIKDIDESGKFIQPSTYASQNPTHTYVAASDLLRQNAPSNFNAVAATGLKCDLSWTSVNGILYKIYRDGNLIFTTDASASTYQDTELTEDQIYFYHIVPVNSYGTYGYQTQDQNIKAIV